MSNNNGCAYVTLLILLLSYEVSTQNYYHTFDTEKEGDYDFILNRSKPEHLFGSYGNSKSPQRTILNGHSRNIQKPILNPLYNYHVPYKPLIEKVPAKIINVQPMNDSKDANENLTPKIDAYLVAHELNNGYDGEDLKLATKENGTLDNNNALEYSKPIEVNDEYTKYEKQADSTKIETLVTAAGNKTVTSTDRNGEIIKPIHTMNILLNKAKSEEVQLIGEPFIKNTNLNIGDNLPRTKSSMGDNKSLLQNLDMKNVKEHVKKIEITLPESDSTTVIISSRNEDESSGDTKKESQQKQKSHLAHEQNISSVNNLTPNRRNLSPKNKAIEFNKNKSIDLALNRRIWQIPLAYAINSHKVNAPFYCHLYPNNKLYPRM